MRIGPPSSGVQHAVGVYLHVKALKECWQFIGFAIGLYLGLVVVIVTQCVVQLGRRQTSVTGEDFFRRVSHLMVLDQYFNRNASPPHHGPPTADARGSGDMRMVSPSLDVQPDLNDLLFGQIKRMGRTQYAVLVSRLYDSWCIHNSLRFLYSQAQRYYTISVYQTQKGAG